MILLRNRHYKLASDSSSTPLFRSLGVLAWDLLKFPWNWRACCSIPTPSSSITPSGIRVCMSRRYKHVFQFASVWMPLNPGLSDSTCWGCFALSSVDPADQKKTACYDIDVEVDDPLKSQMNNFLSSTTNQQEIAALEMKAMRSQPNTLHIAPFFSCTYNLVLFWMTDSWDNWVHQPAEDRERLYAELQ